MTWTNCPSFAELFAADADLSDELREHVASCRRCQALRRHLEPSDAVEAAVVPLENEPLRPELETEPRSGSVYVIHGPLSDEYVLGALVDWDDEEAVVVPLSDEVRFATNWDLLLEQKLLGYPAMAEVWNHGTVLVEQLREKIAELGAAVAALEALYAAALDGTELTTALPVGPPVLSEIDPRNAFQDQEGERTTVYWQPARVLAGVESAFDLVRAQREDLGVAPAALGAVEPRALEQLEAGNLDLVNEIPVTALAELLHRLQVAASRRLQRLIEAAGSAAYREPLETRPAIARKRRGMRKPAQAVDRQRVVSEYANHVIEEMKEMEQKEERDE